MKNRTVKTRLGSKAEIVVPKPVCDALRVKPGDELTFVIEDERVRVLSAASPTDDPFAAFAEWDSEADRTGYAEL